MEKKSVGKCLAQMKYFLFSADARFVESGFEPEVILLENIHSECTP